MARPRLLVADAEDRDGDGGCARRRGALPSRQRARRRRGRAVRGCSRRGVALAGRRRSSRSANAVRDPRLGADVLAAVSIPPTRRSAGALLAGVLLGLGLHGYATFRVVPVAAALFFVIAAVERRRGGAWMHALVDGALAYATALVAAIPFVHYAVRFPDLMFTRMTDRANASQGLGDTVSLSSTTRAMRCWPSTGAVTSAGCSGCRATVPRRPERRTAARGPGRSSRWSTARRSAAAVALLATGPVLLLSSTLNFSYPIENPSAGRLSVAVPFTFTVAALPRGIPVAGDRPRTAVGRRASALLRASSRRHPARGLRRGGTDELHVLFPRLPRRSMPRAHRTRSRSLATIRRQNVSRREVPGGLSVLARRTPPRARARGLRLGDHERHRAGSPSSRSHDPAADALFVLFGETGQPSSSYRRYPDGRYIGGQGRHRRTRLRPLRAFRSRGE